MMICLMKNYFVTIEFVSSVFTIIGAVAELSGMNAVLVCALELPRFAAEGSTRFRFIRPILTIDLTK